MKIKTYENASSFLHRTQEWLEEEEAANSLILGLAFRLERQSGPTDPLYLATVVLDGSLLLAAVMTPPHNIVLSGRDHEAEPAIRPLIQSLRDKKWPIPGVVAPKELAGSFTRRWLAMAGGSHHLVRQTRVHELRQVVVPPPDQGALRLATTAEFPLVLDWVLAFQEEALGERGSESELEATREQITRRLADGSVYLWDDAGPVSMAMKLRPIRNGISVSYVYTPPHLRRRGYATACVGELSRSLIASGYTFCALFTDQANPTSNHIYWEIGYRPVADFDEIHFQGESQ